MNIIALRNPFPGSLFRTDRNIIHTHLRLQKCLSTQKALLPLSLFLWHAHLLFIGFSSFSNALIIINITVRYVLVVHTCTPNPNQADNGLLVGLPCYQDYAAPEPRLQLRFQRQEIWSCHRSVISHPLNRHQSGITNDVAGTMAHDDSFEQTSDDDHARRWI